MRKPVVLLALTTAIFAGSTLYLWLDRRAEPPVADSFGARLRPGPSAGDPDRIRAESKSAPTAMMAAPEARSPAGADQPPRYSRDAQRFLDQMANPLQHQELHRIARIGMRHQNPGLDRYLALDAAQYEPLVDLMAEQFLQTREGTLRCAMHADCQWSPAAQRVRDTQELTALLGPEGKQRYDEYRDSLPERTRVTLFRGGLADANYLADAQADALVAALADERRRVAAEMEQHSQSPGMIYDDVPFVVGPGVTQDKLVAQARDYLARLRARAAQVLTPAQLAEFDQMQAEQMNVLRDAAEGAVAHFYGE